MYYYLKWVICGILILVNPIVAVILFVGWCALDWQLYKRQINVEILNDLSILWLEESTWESPFWCKVDFRSMIFSSGCNDYPSSQYDANIVRDASGIWYRKYTEKTRNERLTHYQSLIGQPLYDEADHKETYDWEWTKIEFGQASKIEMAYQKYLISYSNLIK